MCSNNCLSQKNRLVQMLFEHRMRVSLEHTELTD